MFEKSSSQIIYNGDQVIKKQPKTGADKEFGFLFAMRNTPFVPKAKRIDEETIVMEKIVHTPIEDKKKFIDHCYDFYHTLICRGIRHGDLTPPHVIPRNDFPVVIDWSDSKWASDPTPDKRPNGDSYWFWKTISKILGEENYMLYTEQVNLRSEKILGFILSAIAHRLQDHNKDFTFFDLGYGYGDIIIRLHKLGYEVSGVEKDDDLYQRMKGFGIKTYHDDIENFIHNFDPIDKFDLIICTSVIPYLRYQDKIIEWIAHNSHLSVFEIQSEGDGPGTLESQIIVEDYLMDCHFDSVTQIGVTLVKENLFERRLFLCENPKS